MSDSEADKMSALASANKTSDKSEPIQPIRDPSIEPPERFKRMAKEPGSKVLIFGEWVNVEDEEEFRAQRLAAMRRSTPQGSSHDA